MSLHRYLLILFLILSVAFPIPVYAGDEDPYRIGKEDVLDISVWQASDLTKTVTVASDGTIEYPYLGKIQVEGMNPSELKRQISNKLADGYLNDPKVSVTVKEYNSKKILVFGEVVNPGLYKIKKGIALLELLFLVGGTTSEAKRLTVIRPNEQNSGGALPAAIDPNYKADMDDNENSTVHEADLLALLSKGDLNQNIMIIPGDTVYVSSGTGQKYYVLGQVKNPGPYEWTGDITVLEAIKLADGPTELAALNRIHVRRKEGSSEEEIKINVLDIMKGKRKDDVVVKPGNVIIVPRSWI